MRSRDFCYWLQGYFEINGNQPRPPEHQQFLNSEQIKMIKSHLAMVFQHEIDPSLGDKKEQSILDHLHEGQIHSPGGAPGIPEYPYTVKC